MLLKRVAQLKAVGVLMLYLMHKFCYVDNSTKTRLSLIWRSVGFVMQMTI